MLILYILMVIASYWYSGGIQFDDNDKKIY